MKLKKLVCLILTVCMAVVALSGCSSKAPPEGATEAPSGETAEYHIGIVTGTYSQGEDAARGAEKLVEIYGAVEDGGIIKHLTFPDNFASEQETLITVIEGLADDPLMKAIIVNQAVAGTIAAFQNIRAKRPDILLFGGMPQDDPFMVTAWSDLSLNSNSVDRGYYIVKNAQNMGAKTFVHISFPRHMSIELLSRKRMVMEEVCNDLGLKFVFATAPDPLSDVGITGAQQAMLEITPQLVEKYGTDTAFYCTNDAHTEPLIKKVMDLGAIFVEPDTPSPLMGYPGALGLDLKKEAGNWPAILEKIEKEVVARGQSGRMGSVGYSFAYMLSLGLGEFAKNVLDGKAEKDDPEAVIAAFEKYTPGAVWNYKYYEDASTKEESENYLLVLQDTYIFGEGYSGIINEEVPVKYQDIK